MIGVYDDATKEAVLKRIDAGETPYAIQKSTGIKADTVKNWLRTRALAKSDKPPPASLSPATPESGHIVMAIPDMHHPFVHLDALSFLKTVRAEFQPTLFLCLGDEIDGASFSKYIPDPDGMAPGQELRAAIESLTPFYLEFPQMLVCESNHTVRPFKKAFAAGLPAAFLPTYSKLLNAPDGWQWKPRHHIDGVTYMHGDSGRSGQFAAVHYMRALKSSVVIGHIHSYASVFYEDDMFALNSGCLIDVNAYCFKYVRSMVTKPNLGCSIIFGGKWAVFVPMLLDADGRWVGHL